MSISDASASGGVRIEHQDHDHCSVCYEVAFSERFEGDLREGWATPVPSKRNVDSPRDEYEWVCPACFAEQHERLEWAIAPSNS